MTVVEEVGAAHKNDNTCHNAWNHPHGNHYQEHPICEGVSPPRGGQNDQHGKHPEQMPETLKEILADEIPWRLYARMSRWDAKQPRQKQPGKARCEIEREENSPTPSALEELLLPKVSLFCDGARHIRLCSAFHRKADFDAHLPVVHLSLVNIAAHFDHLEPAQVLDGLVRAFNGLFNGVLDGGSRCAGEFDKFIDVVFHISVLRLVSLTV